MIDFVIAFVVGGLLTLVPTLIWMRELRRQDRDRSEERAVLLDRIQSPDLASYYGARAAYHPEDFPAPPEVDLLRDEFGFVEEPREDGRLPGELSASEL